MKLLLHTRIVAASTALPAYPRVTILLSFELLICGGSSIRRISAGKEVP
jgi:hypothetical protein